MNAAERILAGEDIDAVLDEQGPPTTLQNIGTAISKLSDFAFGRGALKKAVGGTPTSSPPAVGASSSVPGMEGKSLAQLAQDSASRSLTKPVAPTVPAAPATKPATRPASESFARRAIEASALADTRPDSGHVPSLKPAANPLKGLTKHLRATPVGKGVLKPSESFVQSLIRKVQEGAFDWQELEKMYGADFTSSGGLKGPGYEEKPTIARRGDPTLGLEITHIPHANILHKFGWKRAHSEGAPRFTHEDFPTQSVELHQVRGTGQPRWMMLHHPDPHEHADLIADGMTAESLGDHLRSMDYDTGSSGMEWSL
jgi:hypothetical protein